jgi:hypothetical protein
VTVPREQPAAAEQQQLDGTPRSEARAEPASAQAKPPSVRDLRLVALAPERSHLVLEDSGGQQYRVPIDSRLAAALRSTPAASGSRHGQLEIPMESALSPREIQARIRAGAGVDEVAREAGVSTDRVERYAAPVVAEREHVLELAQRGPGRRATSGHAPSLQELVARRTTEQGVAEHALQWEATRRDDASSWTVQVSYLAGDRARSAAWSFDPRGRVLSPLDDEARFLVDEPGTPRQEDLPPAAVRRLSAVPGPDEAQVQRATADEVYDREADERGAREPEQQAAPARPARRPSVPSWDDIMFGPRKRD